MVLYIHYMSQSFGCVFSSVLEAVDFENASASASKIFFKKNSLPLPLPKFFSKKNRFRFRFQIFFQKKFASASASI